MKSYLKYFVKSLISILLTQELGNTVYESKFKFKFKNKWVYKLLYGTASDEEIYNSVLTHLNSKVDILMIHSSLNGMMPMYTGNLGKLLNMLISNCDRNNITLAMPTFFLGSNLQAKEFYDSGKQEFDVKNTSSGMGLLSEIFRNTKDVMRSIHPTHSISASGPLADQLIKNHHLSDTTCGDGTPFAEMIKYRTMILGIGTKSGDALTQIHSAEDIMKSNYPIPLYTSIIPVKCIDELGNNIIYNLRVKNPEYEIDRKSFLRILKRMKIQEWTYKGIPFFITQANIVTETLIEAAKNGQIIYKKKKIY